MDQRQKISKRKSPPRHSNGNGANAGFPEKHCPEAAEAAGGRLHIPASDTSNHGPYPFGLSAPLRDVEQLLMRNERGRDILAHRYRRLHVMTEQCSQELAAKFRQLKIKGDIIRQLRDRPVIEPEYLDLKEAAVLSGYAARKIRLLVQLGQLPFVKGDEDLGEGRTTPWLIPRAALLEFMKQKEQRF